MGSPELLSAMKPVRVSFFPNALKETQSNIEKIILCIDIKRLQKVICGV